MGNVEGGLKQINSQAPDFIIDALFTFGAPGVARIPLPNPRSPQKCFKGARFFNIDANEEDPVPWVTRPVGWKHPRVDAIWLYEDDYGYVRITNMPCSAEQAVQLPVSDMRCLKNCRPPHGQVLVSLRKALR